MRGVGDGLYHVGEGRRAADSFEVALSFEPLDDDGRVDPLSRIVKVEQVPIEELVRLVGEILRPHDQRDVVAHVGLEQNAAEHGPFGVDVGRPFSRVEQRRCDRLAVAITPRPTSFAVSVAPAAVSRCSHRRASVREPSRVPIRIPTATPTPLRREATRRCGEPLLRAAFAAARHHPDLEIAFNFRRQLHLHGVEANLLQRSLKNDLLR